MTNLEPEAPIDPTSPLSILGALTRVSDAGGTASVEEDNLNPGFYRFKIGRIWGKPLKRCGAEWTHHLIPVATVRGLEARGMIHKGSDKRYRLSQRKEISEAARSREYRVRCLGEEGSAEFEKQLFESQAGSTGQEKLDYMQALHSTPRKKDACEPIEVIQARGHRRAAIQPQSRTWGNQQ